MKNLLLHRSNNIVSRVNSDFTISVIAFSEDNTFKESFVLTDAQAMIFQLSNGKRRLPDIQEEVLLSFQELNAVEFIILVKKLIGIGVIRSQ